MTPTGIARRVAPVAPVVPIVPTRREAQSPVLGLDPWIAAPIELSIPCSWLDHASSQLGDSRNRGLNHGHPAISASPAY